MKAITGIQMSLSAESENIILKVRKAEINATPDFISIAALQAFRTEGLVGMFRLFGVSFWFGRCLQC